MDFRFLVQTVSLRFIILILQVVKYFLIPLNLAALYTSYKYLHISNQPDIRSPMCFIINLLFPDSVNSKFIIIQISMFVECLVLR